MDLRLIALDLDGTTLNSQGKVSPYTKKILEKDANSKGCERMALFEVITNDNYNMFSMQYELLLTNYYNNREFIKEYRKFKEKTCMYT